MMTHRDALVSKVLPAIDRADVEFNRLDRPDSPLRPIPPGRDYFAPRWKRSREFLFGPWIDIEEEAAPSEFTRWRDDYFWQADEHIIPVVDMFERLGHGDARAIFEQALTNGIDTVDSPPPELVRFFDRIDTFPDWLDLAAAQRGRTLVSSATMLSVMAILGWAVFETTMTGDISAATGAAGRFQHQGLRRQVETVRMFGLMSHPSVFERHSEAFHTITRVRLMHGLVSRGLKRKWGPEIYLKYGEPIAASSLLGFGNGPLLLRLADHQLGRRLSRGQLDDIAMYAAYTSWLLGAPDNLRTRDGIELVKSLNYVFARGGDPSAWRAELLDSFAGMIRESTDIRLRKASPAARERSVHVAKVGMACSSFVPLAMIFGPDQVDAMVEGTEFEKLGIDYTLAGRWFERAARIYARTAALRERAPGVTLLRNQVHGRIVPQAVLRIVNESERLLLAGQGAGSTYTHHDKSTGGAGLTG
ncbi:oxygenase MpaB family protein [Gordonia effusa]|uniref:oxygenase MpaB family protein n=1 Tax=Gordonia effusa TaxID=263908 RepID=UPI001FDFF778|nr:oxygenase MpaB family protein [Gordonia effusa]